MGLHHGFTAAVAGETFENPGPSRGRNFRQPIDSPSRIGAASIYQAAFAPLYDVPLSCFNHGSTVLSNIICRTTERSSMSGRSGDQDARSGHIISVG
jgi:hypothetical protein